jgi:hypothetical protein
MTNFDDERRTRLSTACRAAVAYRSSGLVRLRHQALVGHGLGVPSRDRVLATWEHSRTAIAQHGPLAEAVLSDDGYPLPGLPSLFSAIAGVPLTPDTILRDTRDEVANELDPQQEVWRDEPLFLAPYSS